MNYLLVLPGRVARRVAKEMREAARTEAIEFRIRLLRTRSCLEMSCHG
jgi:hypothetical protein